MEKNWTYKWFSILFNTKHCTRRQIRLPTLFHFQIDYEHTQFVSEQEGQEKFKTLQSPLQKLGEKYSVGTQNISPAGGFMIVDPDITPCHFYFKTLPQHMRGIDPVTGYGDKQQLPTVAQIKEDAVYVRETSLLNLIIL